MFESPFVFALAFFGLGFVAGIVVAALFQAGKSSPPVVQSDNQPERMPVPPASISEPADKVDQEPEQAGAGKVGPATNTPQEPVAWVSSLSSEPKVQPEQVSASPIESFLHSVRSSTVKEPAKPRTIAAEIDAILQEKLPDSDLAGRLVRLEEQPDFGLLVVVDGDKYAGVNAVPDEAVRNLIKSAVAEWQDRSSSNTSA